MGCPILGLAYFSEVWAAIFSEGWVVRFSTDCEIRIHTDFNSEGFELQGRIGQPNRTLKLKQLLGK